MKKITIPQKMAVDIVRLLDSEKNQRRCRDITNFLLKKIALNNKIEQLKKEI